MYWPFAGLTVVMGLSTEAIIFFFSAFEPPHEELDWTLVYPELAGMTDPDELEEIRSEELTGRGVGLQKFDELFKEASISPETVRNLSLGLESLNENTKNLADLTEATVATKDYLNNMRNAPNHKYSPTHMTVFGNQRSVQPLPFIQNQLILLINQESVLQNLFKSSSELTTSYHNLPIG